MQKKQSILWLTSSYPRYEQDSASIFLRYLAEAIDDKAFDLHILSPDNQSVDNSIHSPTIFLHYFKYFLPRKMQKLAYGSGILPNLEAKPLLLIQVPFFLLSQFFSCYRLVKKLNPALIHAHWVFPQGTIASLIGKLTNTPVIITAHGGDAFALKGSLSVFPEHPSSFFHHWLRIFSMLPLSIRKRDKNQLGNLPVIQTFFSFDLQSMLHHRQHHVFVY
ncbi:glycosyltransferase [Bathymodiolus platifrons methanotrophic gill symbiont]|uniref:glycosyltransferase n=1 Tax=Bathymodiolus platifrons methanotrophic gill symbiont TaxID=113268 RepID=UPI001C8D38A5